jgi:crooked neck
MFFLTFKDKAREIYEQCISILGEEFIDQNFYVSFAKFETRLKEIERARAIYKYALEKIPQGQNTNLYNMYTQFEKQNGGKLGVEDVVVTKRRKQYEDVINVCLNSHIRLLQKHHPIMTHGLIMSD